MKPAKDWVETLIIPAVPEQREYFENVIKQIQFDAWKAGMDDAIATVIRKGAVFPQCKIEIGTIIHILMDQKQDKLIK